MAIILCNNKIKLSLINLTKLLINLHKLKISLNRLKTSLARINLLLKLTKNCSLSLLMFEFGY